MASKIGKVVEFDNYVGEIVDADDRYMFIDTDLLNPVQIGDYVSFKSEKMGDINRAFFVEKLDREKVKSINYKLEKKYDFKN